MLSKQELTQPEAFARIRLLRSPNIGPVSYRQLLARFGTAAAALDALPDLARRGGAPYRPAPAERIEQEARLGDLLRRRLRKAGWTLASRTPLPVVTATGRR